jgi:hypothetical protein
MWDCRTSAVIPEALMSIECEGDCFIATEEHNKFYYLGFQMIHLLYLLFMINIV